MQQFVTLNGNFCVKCSDTFCVYIYIYIYILINYVLRWLEGPTVFQIDTWLMG